MKPKRAVAGLLLTAIAMTTMAQQRGNEKKEQITSQEDWEARSLAENFIARFEDSPELTPLIDEMYVPDFKIHLRKMGVIVCNPVATIKPSVVTQASDDELRRCYAGSMTFMYLLMRFYGSALWIGKQSEIEEAEKHEDPSFEEILPPKVVAVLKSDSILAGLLSSDDKKNSAEENANPSSDVSTPRDAQNQQPGDSPSSQSQPSQIFTESSVVVGTGDTAPKRDGSDTYAVNSREQLTSLLSTLERANALMRESAKSLPLVKSLMEVVPEKDSDEQTDALNPRITIVSEEWLGFPAGTRLICVNALVFHMDLVRVSGQLKIAALYIVID